MHSRKLLAAGLALLVPTIFLVAACSDEKVSEPTPVVLSGESVDAMTEDSDAQVVTEDKDADAMMDDKNADATMEDSDGDAMMDDADGDAMMEDSDGDATMEEKEQDLMVGEKDAMRQCPDCSSTAVLARDLGGSGSYRFDPDGLSFQVGETVEFTVTSETEFHTFTIDELGIDVSVSPGETETFTFTFQEAGTFKLVCLPHQSLGMAGTITVVNGADAMMDDKDADAMMDDKHGDAMMDDKGGDAMMDGGRRAMTEEYLPDIVGASPTQITATTGSLA